MDNRQVPKLFTNFRDVIRLSNKKISQTELLSIPAFIRFNSVQLGYSYYYDFYGLEFMKHVWLGSLLYERIKQKIGYEWIKQKLGYDYEMITKKCERFQMLLQPIKHAINGAKFEFMGQINNNNSFHDFTDNSMLLAHLEKELLPICNACRSYKFVISWPDNSAITNVIATILQFGPIDGCSEVLFNLYSRYLPTELPVVSIVNWLNRGPNSDMVNAYWQVKKERILEIDSNRAYIPNLLALVNGVKKVNLNNLCHKK